LHEPGMPILGLADNKKMLLTDDRKSRR